MSRDTIEALISTNERLNIALRASRIGIWELDIKTGAIIWDDNVYKIFGLKKSAFDNTLPAYFKLIHPDDHQFSSKKIQRAIDNNQNFHIQHRVYKADGSVIWLEGWGKVIGRSKSKPGRLIGAVAEITSRKETELSLQQRDRLFYSLSLAMHGLLAHGDLSQAISEGLRTLGEAVEADRVYLFENDIPRSNEPATTSQRFEWNSGVGEPQINNPDLQHFPLSEFEPCATILSRGQHYMGHVRELENKNLKEVLAAQGIKSVLVFPIIVRKSFWGFVGLDECKQETEWNNIQLSVLRSFTSAVSRALENKISEDEKQEWKTRYELIAASSGQVIYDYNPRTGSIVWGGNVQELLGYSKTEMGNIDRWVELIHPDDRERSLSELDKAEESLSSYDVMYRFCHKDGNYLFMHDRGFFVSEDGRKANRMLGMMRDVTEMKKSERELMESEERYRTLLAASFSGIGIHDLGVFVEVNQGLADLSGYSIEELIGMQSLSLLAPEYRDVVIEKIKSGNEEPYDVEAVQKNGTKRYLEIHGKNIPYRNKIMRVTEFRDITDRKIAEEKTIEQNEKLTSIAKSLTYKNRQLEEFTQIVSHNLRSPVGNLNSLIALLDQASDKVEREEVLKMLRQSGQSLLSTLNELNDVLKVKQDLNIEKQVLQFDQVLKKAKHMTIAQINESSAIIKSNFSEAPELLYPNIYLESIFLNLLSNALKYRHPERKPIVEFRTFSDGQQLILEVSDNGQGINLERYGHQMFKLRKTFHDHPEARGVGLFLIKNQVEAMGGEIKVESTEGVGTTFIINFNREGA